MNLTVNGKKDSIRYQPFRARAAPTIVTTGIDLSKPPYFAAYGEWTKKAGIARLEPGKPGVKMLTWTDASFPALMKAENGDAYVFSQGTSLEAADYYVADASLATPGRLTEDGGEQVAKYAGRPACSS